jgi:hypothetical protein
VSQGEGPEFKPQDCKKKKKEEEEKEEEASSEWKLLFFLNANC